MRGAAHDQHLLFAVGMRGQGRQAFGDDLGRQHIEFGAFAFELGQDLRPSRIQRASAQLRIQIVGSFRQRRGRQADRRVDQPVLHLAVFRNDDNQRLARSDAQKFHMLENRILFGGDDQAGAARQAGQQCRRLDQDFFHAVAGPTHARFDGGAFGRRQFADLQKPVDEQSQAPFGRNAPGAGMRRGEQPHRLQIGHDIADRGRRQGDRQKLGQGARTHGLPGGQERLDQTAKDFALPVGQELYVRPGRGHIQAFESVVIFTNQPTLVCVRVTGAAR